MLLKDNNTKSENESQVIISIKSDNLSRVNIDVAGFKNVGIRAKDYLEPYILKYNKVVGQSSLNVEQVLRRQSEALGDYEDLESYEMRTGNVYVG